MNFHHKLCTLLPSGRIISVPITHIERLLSYIRRKESGVNVRCTRHMERKLQKKVRYESHFDKYKKKFTKMPVASSACLIVLSTGANGLGRSVILKTDLDRYLFNCGEGMQKTLTECVSKLGPVDNIFFTYNTWNNVGGVMGFLFSNTSDVIHSKKIGLHGPPNVDKMLEMTRMFSESHIGKLASVEWLGIDKVRYEDDQVTIDYVELLSGETVSASTPPQSSSDSDLAEIKLYPADGFQSKRTVMAYIIRLRHSKRKVDTAKLVALNVKSGPWVKKLVDGEEVTLEDGRLVKPEDILSEEEESLGPIVVVDCPTTNYLDSLTASKQFLELCTEGNTMPHMIVHMAPTNVIDDPRYKTFMDRYHSNTIHLMLNENSAGPYLHESHQFQSVLSYLHPDIFPALQGHLTYNRKPKPQTGNIIQACYGLKYQVKPTSQQGFMWEDLLYSNKEASFNDAKGKSKLNAEALVPKVFCEDTAAKLTDYQHGHIDDVILELRTNILTKDIRQDILDEFPEVVFLGTGSAKPTLSRNASGILVQMRKDEYLLMDCGEGSLLQLYQLYGLEKTYHILANLKAIFISHLHFDHHGGLFGILEARWEAIGEQDRSDALTVLAPIPLKKWFYLYSRCISQVESSIQFIPHHIIYADIKNGLVFNHLATIKRILDVTEYIPMPVKHVSNSYGISLKHKDGWKLVYSGDTMPCQDLVRYGKDCDILIHEATFDDLSNQDAALKHHSTTSQAIEVGRKMNAKFILLTHFSQRFSKIPHFTENFTENVGFSFDFMQVRPSQLELIPLFKPTLDLLYGAALELKLIKRRQTIEREALKDQAYEEKAQSQRRQSDWQYQQQQHRDMEIWSDKAHAVKSKLKMTEQEEKVKKQIRDCEIAEGKDDISEGKDDIAEGKDDVAEGKDDIAEGKDDIECDTMEVSNKRKAKGDSEVNKIRKTRESVAHSVTNISSANVDNGEEMESEQGSSNMTPANSDNEELGDKV